MGAAGGVVEDEAVGSVRGGVVGKEDDGLVEGAVTQGGIGQKQLSLELDGVGGV